MLGAVSTEGLWHCRALLCQEASAVRRGKHSSELPSTNGGCRGDSRGLSWASTWHAGRLNPPGEYCRGQGLVFFFSPEMNPEWGMYGWSGVTTYSPKRDQDNHDIPYGETAQQLGWRPETASSLVRVIQSLSSPHRERSSRGSEIAQMEHKSYTA